MTHIHIGATRAGGQTPCHTFAEWEALLAAMGRNDSAEIVRITTTTRPTMIAAASLKPVPRPTTKDVAVHYWAKRGQTPKARAAGPDGTPIVASVRT